MVCIPGVVTLTFGDPNRKCRGGKLAVDEGGQLPNIDEALTATTLSLPEFELLERNVVRELLFETA